MDNSDNSFEKRLSELEASINEIKRMLQASTKNEFSDSDVIAHSAKPVKKTEAAPKPEVGLWEKELKPTPLIKQQPMAPPPPLKRHQNAPPPPPIATKQDLSSLKTVGKGVSTPSPAINIPKHMRTGEYWLNKAGIALILFGVLFAFKYSVEQGWITPPVRHLFGLGVGFLLLGFGFKVYSKQKHFSLVLLGGSIGTFYMTGFSAYQLFSIVSHPVAMAYMIVVTILAFAISLRQNEPILSIIGTIGALGTPFLLYSDSGNVEGLVIYTSLIIAGTAGIYFYKGWRSLLWVSVLGGWAVLLIAMDAIISLENSIDSMHLAVQGSVIFAWLIFWATPVIREVAWVTNPERWSRSTIGFADKSISQSALKILDRHVHLLAVSSPLITLAISLNIWSWIDDSILGGCAIGVAILYGAVSHFLKKWDSLIVLARTHLAVSLLLLTVGLSLILDGSTLFITLATEGLVLHLIARRTEDSIIRVGANILFSILFFWMFIRLTPLNEVTPAIINMHSMSNLWVIGVALASAWVVRKKEEQNIYLLAGALLLALWQMREFHEDIVVLTIMIEATLLQYIGRKLKDRIIIDFTSVAILIPVLWLLYRVVYLKAEAMAVINWPSLADFSTIGILAIFSFILNDKVKRSFYLIACHIILLSWMARELLSLEDGQGYLTIVWGVYAISLLILGLRKDLARVRQVALATIMLVVGKLFLIDLSRLETIWRVLLFVGFGGLLMVISYFFRSLWRGKSDLQTGKDDLN